MSTEPEVMDFVKAMASAVRLRVVGALVRGHATQAEIANQLHLPVRDVFQHLSFLVHVGVVREEDGVYEMDDKAVETLARAQFEGKRPAYESKEEKPEDVRKVLKAYLNPDGTIKKMPQEGRKMEIILHFILDAFPLDATFTEKEVNTILRRFHVDTATLRRNLIDYGLMARESDGSKYWRLAGPAKGGERGVR
jgi:hypothetical protein